MIWWVIWENRLTIGFRNAFFMGNPARNFQNIKSSVGNTVGNVVENAVRNAAGNLVGNGWGNDAVFSLNTWLRRMYCLQTIHEPTCVILTLFQFFVLL